MTERSTPATTGLGALGSFKLTHIPTGNTLDATVITTAFEHSVAPKFSSEEVYGRMDPIMTYQNTKRSFTYVFKTPGFGSVYTEAQKDLFVKSGRLTSDHFLAAGKFFKLQPSGIAVYLSFVGQLYQMMYPYYEGGNNAGGASFLKAAPLLRLKVGGLTGGGESSTLLFAPETFKVSSIAADASKLAINVGSVAELRFGASGDGYTITMGGTVLHEDGLVGWVEGENGIIKFGQGVNFPFRTEGDAQPAAIGLAPVAQGKSPRDLSEGEKKVKERAENTLLKSFGTMQAEQDTDAGRKVRSEKMGSENNK